MQLALLLRHSILVQALLVVLVLPVRTSCFSVSRSVPDFQSRELSAPHAQKATATSNEPAVNKADFITRHFGQISWERQVYHENWRSDEDRFGVLLRIRMAISAA